jgi:hypothetical protein
VSEEDDDFWTTYIAATPEEDGDFTGCGKPVLWLALAALLFALLLLMAG